ncbi:PREDICTED: coiled-coil domain-containing protein 37 [Chlamydotis macqueenii]|uniref:coiled-coil domain-containing protein 37 n=1 Tax=Chlamydotis macqueenii TaxID=187382 RepID=UPI000529FB4F|nr:PREDICTED: coiled-coil domain-containing protein 37 [Chlamydotis macqueenii]
MSVLSNDHPALSEETHSAEAIPGSKMPSPHTESTSESLSSKPGTENQLVLPESPEEDEENPMKNPFTISSDIDIFSIRDKERKKAKAERERMKTMKIHEKMTYSTTIKAKQKEFRKALQKEEKEEGRRQATNEERLKTLQKTLLSRKTAFKKDYPPEKETFHDYINNRRKIFSLEYAMAVKRDEIQKMDNIIKNEERKLEKAKQHLEKEATMFEEFLWENHKNSVQAVKIAKKETAAKTKKIMEIRTITSHIENLQSDISRFKNTLQEYKMYRDFLYQLSPKEWQEEHGKKHTMEKDLKTAPKANEESASPPTTTEQGDFTDVPTSLLSLKSLEFSSLHEIKPQLKNILKPLSTRKLSLKDEESETCSDEDEEPELYFTDPQQLLSIFTEMEEENLSLIQNSQEIEESLNKVQHTFTTTYESTEKKLAELKQQVVTLKSSIAKEEERLADLKLKVHLFSSGEDKADDQDKMLTSLNEKVLEVYGHCTGENETNLQTVQMLIVIEKHLYDLLDNLERIPPAKVEQALKAKRKERRIRLREEKLRQQGQQQEERLQRALERSQATIKKPSGRRPMVHSNPPAREEKKKNSQEQMDKEKEEQLYYFT